MGIFSSIKDFIFGKHPAAAAPAGQAIPVPQATSAAIAPATTMAPAPTVAEMEPVDVAAILDAQAAQHAEKLNWRTSIVDLMKLCGLDSNLEHRKELAKELGYQGDTSDSAAMNIWLHAEVMDQLAQSGGKVPANL